MNRHPLRRHSLWIAVLGLVSTALINLGLDLGQWVDWGVNLLNVLVLAGVLVRVGEYDVTPTSDPQLDDGTRLVPDIQD